MSSNNPLSNIPPLGPPSGMAPTAGHGKFKPVDPMKILRQYWILFAFTGVIAAGIGVGTWYLLDKYMPQYTSVAQLSVNKGLSSAGDAVTSDVNIRELEPEIQNNIQRLRSEEFLQAAIRKESGILGSIRKDTRWYQAFNSNDLEAARDLKDDRVRASHMTNTTLIRLAVSTADKTDAQLILENIVATYLERVNSDDANRITRDRAAFTNQRAIAADEVQKMIDKIDAEMSRNESAGGDVRFEIISQELSQKATRRADIQSYLSSVQGSYQMLLARQQANDFEPSAADIFEIERSQEIVALDSQIRSLQASRESLITQGIAPNNRAVLRLDSEIRALQQKRDEEFDKKARELFNKNIEEAKQAVDQFTEQLNEVEDQITELQARRRDLQRFQEELERMNRELVTLEKSRDQYDQLIYNLNTVADRTVSVAVYTLPTEAEKTFPKIEIIAPGVTILLLGLVVGGVFLKELMDQRVKGPGDVKALPDTVMLGMVPDAGEDASSKAGVERIVEKEPAGLLAESFRQVRTAVLSKMDRRGYKTLMLVGAKPQAGVSSVAQNLGASMALSGRRVLLLDANFRRPAQAKLAGVAGDPGLAELLSGQLSPDQAEQAIRHNDQLSLDILPAGGSSAISPELLETPAFRELLIRLESAYDVILIDVAPALLASEAKLLAKHVDAVAIVCRAMADTRGILQKVLGELDGQRADILGVILNGVRAAAGGYMRKNFREFYRYRGTERNAPSRPVKRASATAAATKTSVPAQTNGSATNGHYDEPGESQMPGDDEIDFNFEDDDDQDR